MVEINIVGLILIGLLLLFVTVITVVNLVVAILSSMVLSKVFELVSEFEERFQIDEDAKRQARGLIDINTPQIPYNMRSNV